MNYTEYTNYSYPLGVTYLFLVQISGSKSQVSQYTPDTLHARLSTHEMRHLQEGSSVKIVH